MHCPSCLARWPMDLSLGCQRGLHGALFLSHTYLLTFGFYGRPDHLALPSALPSPLALYFVKMHVTNPPHISHPPTAKAATMQLFVKSLSGRTLTVDAQPAQLVSELKSAVQGIEGIPADEQRLVCGGAELVDDRSLESYDIEGESTIDLSLRLLGGGKKKKKKNYTTPKKSKHKHKKVHGSLNVIVLGAYMLLVIAFSCRSS